MSEGRLARLLRPSVEREVDDELEFHLEMRARELAAGGLLPPAARRAAEQRFSDLEATRRECRRIARHRDRDRHRREHWGEVRQDVAFAVRQMGRSPGFSALAVLTLALGIGATTAIFSVFYAVVLQPLPFPDADRIQVVATTRRDGPGNTSVGNFVYIEERQRSFAPLAAVDYRRFNLADGDQPQRVAGAAVTWDYFAVFGMDPLLGRTFRREEDAPGSDRVVVLSHRLWKRSFGADPAVVGRRVVLSGVSREVIGVMPEGLQVVDGVDLWVPIAFTPERRVMYDEHFLDLYGRLRPGVSLAAARADLQAVARQLARDHPRENEERGATAWPLGEEIVGASRGRMGVLLGAVFLVLLIASVNVANLLLGRGSARAREIALRAALGAGRARIGRQLLTESLLLGLLAAAVGLVLAEGGRRLFLATAPEGLPRLASAQIDLRALAFAVGVSLVASLAFGLAPALQATRVDLRGGLTDAGRQATAGAGRDRIRRLLVAAEVALALTLLVGAGLLVRTGLNLLRAPLGFDPSGLLTARVGLPREGYEGHEKTARAFEDILEQLRSRPEVAASAFVSKLPLTPGQTTNGLFPEGGVFDPKNLIDTNLQIVTPGYFEAMRIPLRAGRYLTEADRRSAPRVMVIDEELARLAFPGRRAVGRRIACCEGSPDEPSWKEVVGVVASVATTAPGAPPKPQFYLPMDQVPVQAWDWIGRTLVLVVRARRSPPLVLPLVREAVRTVDPSVPVYDVMTMAERRRGRMAQERFGAVLLSVLGLVGLVLAGVGIYGVVAWFVSQRTREIAVRIALGASAGDVVRMVVRQALGPVLAGVALGGVGALAAGRALRAMVYGVGLIDSTTLVGVVAVFVVVAALASGLPARRATRVDPARALADA
jgi:putative ABC transport system permease protein